jgi:anti-sigma factor ChrR (cupin superfamily)
VTRPQRQAAHAALTAALLASDQWPKVADRVLVLLRTLEDHGFKVTATRRPRPLGPVLETPAE